MVRALLLDVSRKDYCLQGLQFDTLGGALKQLPDRFGDLFSPAAFTICVQWLLLQVMLDRLLPGKVSKQTKNSRSGTVYTL